MNNKLEFFKQKWVSKQFDDYNVEFLENHEIAAGEIVGVAILLDKKCVAFGYYFDELTISEGKDSRFYFHSIGMKNSFGCKVAFYFDDYSLLINDFSWVYSYDEKIEDTEVFFERIKSHYFK
jgi:hypothetical protein